MKRKTVSLCMIARNEEAAIGRAIKSVLALVDEIIVVDTGSSDNTRIIAEGYGARIIDHTWQDDFSAARNAALEVAVSDWILVLDCDEHLQNIRPLVFQRLLGDVDVAGYRVRMTGHQAGECPLTDARLRLFRNNPGVRFRYRVHERITPDLVRYAQEAGQVIQDSPLVVIHDPGGPEQTSRKRERNLRLLRQAVGEQPEEPYFPAVLGGETLSWLDEEVLPTAGLRASLAYLEHAWRLILSRPMEQQRRTSCGPLLAVDLAAALLAVGRPEAAADAVETARHRWQDSARLRIQGIRAQLACLVRDQDPERQRSRAASVRRELGRLDVLLAAGHLEEDTGRLCMGLVERFRGELALAEGNITTAAEAFERALDLNQESSFAWVGLAECARLAGDRKRALRLYLRAVTASGWNVRAWERGTDLMQELGFHDNARSWRAKIQERFPERAGAAEPREPSCPGRSGLDVVGIA